MEGIFTFIVILAIVVINIIGKIRTEAKESQEPLEPRGRPISRNDIPEATRRMLYGDGSDIQVAKPRTASSEHRSHSSTPAHPVAARQLDMGPEHRVSPPKPPQPVHTPSPPRPPQPVRQMGSQSSVPVMKREMPTMARNQPTISQPVRQQYSRPQRYQPRPRPQPPRRTVVIEEEREGPKQKYVPPRRKTKPQTMAVHTPSSGMGLAGLLASKNDLARGILLREILGPPKAFEDFG